jgi:hypothetical protein
MYNSKVSAPLDRSVRTRLTHYTMANTEINLQNLDQHDRRRVAPSSNVSSEISVLNPEPHTLEQHRTDTLPEPRISRRPVASSNPRDSTELSHQPLVSNGDRTDLPNDKTTEPTKGKAATYLAVLAWWKPELFASFLSIASFVSIVVVLRIYDGVALTELNLPRSLTLNSVIAALATVNRACLMTPVCSALFQQMWLYLAKESKEQRLPRCQLRDLELYADASTGAWGSLVFLCKARVSR